jgi:hypothetical protein
MKFRQLLSAALLALAAAFTAGYVAIALGHAVDMSEARIALFASAAFAVPLLTFAVWLNSSI